jgi:hypothetical protein
MSTILRAFGWLLFGGGAITFIALGGFTAAREGNMLAMAAGVLMPIGMLLTATSTLVSNWAAARSRAQLGPNPFQEARPEAPPRPDKSYAARPLDASKLTPEAKQRLEEERRKP